MNRTNQTIGCLGMLLTLLAAGQAAADDSAWRLKLTGAAAQSTGGGDTSFGAGLGLEYRASRRLGVELSALTSELKDNVAFDFFGEETLTIESTLRMTPVLAKLNLHLTPDHRADLYLGPVVGRMQYSDLDIEVRGGGESARFSAKTKDDWAWGAHVGVDVPIGERGAFFTAGATWLKAEVEIEGDPEEEEGGGDARFDLDPLIAQIGFGYRF